MDAVAHDGVANDPVYRPGDSSDYPILGIDGCCFYQTNGVCRFRLPGEPGYDPQNPPCDYRYWHVAFYPAGPMANGVPGPSLSGWQYWNLTNPDGSMAGLIQPAVHHGAGLRTYFVSRFGGNQLLIWALTNPLQTNQQIARVAVAVSPFTFPPVAPQMGGAKPIETRNLGTDVLKAVYRNNFLYLTTNDARDWDNRGELLASVRLVRLNVATYPAIPTDSPSGFVDRPFGARSSTDDPPGAYFHYAWPAVEVNQYGDMAIVYARMGRTIYPEVRFSAYYAADPDMRPSRLLKAGEAAYRVTYSGYDPPTWPWADLAGASVDPYDDTAIWIAQQYATVPAPTTSNNGNFEVWVGKVFGRLYPDLYLPDLTWCCGMVRPEDSLTANVKIANQGDGPSPASRLEVYLSADGAPSRPDVLVGELNVPSLPAGANATFTLTGKVSTSLTPGLYSLRAVVDPDNRIAEYSKGNNTRVAGARVQVEPRPSISANGIVNTASYVRGSVAPGEIVTLFGSGIGPESSVGLQLDASGLVATSLADTRVLFDGTPAALIYAKADAVSAVVPYEVAARSGTQVQVEYRGVRTGAVSMPVSESAPGIFTLDASGRGQGAMLNEDGSLNGPANPARKGSIVVWFATGEGQTNPAGINGKLAAPPYPEPLLSVVAAINDIGAEILYAGAAPGLVAGVMQVNLRVPDEAPSGNAVPVILKVGDSFSQAGVTMAVR
ncbi:MAG: hypothetical protein HYR60_06365 [Acidobacteria bacterium]|nr:hypothetical protein [Acidobacteriota bacterium]